MNKIETTLLDRIETMLLDIGITPSQRGFAYISAALSKISREDRYMYDTCALYAAIAEDFSVTPSRVERCIRHSVESAFNRVDPDTIHRYFGNLIDRLRGKPTNSEFLATVSLHLKGARA